MLEFIGSFYLLLAEFIFTSLGTAGGWLLELHEPV
jgi:hypothetical protein